MARASSPSKAGGGGASRKARGTPAAARVLRTSPSHSEALGVSTTMSGRNSSVSRNATETEALSSTLCCSSSTNSPGILERSAAFALSTTSKASATKMERMVFGAALSSSFNTDSTSAIVSIDRYSEMADLDLDLYSAASNPAGASSETATFFFLGFTFSGSAATSFSFFFFFLSLSFELRAPNPPNEFAAAGADGAEAAFFGLSSAIRLSEPTVPTVSHPSSAASFFLSSSGFFFFVLMPAFWSASRWASSWISSMVLALSSSRRGFQLASRKSHKSRTRKRILEDSSGDFFNFCSCLKYALRSFCDFGFSKAARSRDLPVLVNKRVKHSIFSSSGASTPSPNSSWMQWCSTRSFKRSSVYKAPTKIMCPMYAFLIAFNWRLRWASSINSNSACRSV
mmetsp:Transcript_19864/g.67215  ORF Transcript_19864/g.67215 Transcript_19864/m.67215 type:complete len:398 (-) Transcript_19864:1196-2389(-)